MNSTLISMNLFLLFAWMTLIIGDSTALRGLEMRDASMSHLHRVSSIHGCEQIVDLCQERGLPLALSWVFK